MKTRKVSSLGRVGYLRLFVEDPVGADFVQLGCDGRFREAFVLSRSDPSVGGEPGEWFEAGLGLGGNEVDEGESVVEQNVEYWIPSGWATSSSSNTSRTSRSCRSACSGLTV
jgi:hypothetical protein